jgi:hypothetical protein
MGLDSVSGLDDFEEGLVIHQQSPPRSLFSTLT